MAYCNRHKRTNHDQPPPMELVSRLSAFLSIIFSTQPTCEVFITTLSSFVQCAYVSTF